MTLPYDVARCAKTQANWNCPLRRYCARRVDKGHPDGQVYVQFPGGPECHGFIDVKDH